MAEPDNVRVLQPLCRNRKDEHGAAGLQFAKTEYEFARSQ